MTRLSIILLAVLTFGALGLVTSQHKARKLFVELEREQDSIKRALLVAHNDATALVTAGGFKSTFVSASSRRSVDTKRLQAERPEVADEFMRVSEVSAGCRVTAPRAKKV